MRFDEMLLQFAMIRAWERLPIQSRIECLAAALDHYDPAGLRSSKEPSEALCKLADVKLTLPR